MIPSAIDIGASWAVLPEGIHEVSFDEVKRRFAGTEHRRVLLEGLRKGCESLAEAGCESVLIDGSFVSEKPNPGDFDVCWDPVNVDAERLDPILLDFDNERKAQKEQFGGEFFPSSARADMELTFEEYFQIDKETEKPKGILLIKLPIDDGVKPNDRK